MDPLSHFLKKKLPTKFSNKTKNYNFLTKDTKSHNMPVISKTGVPIIDYPEQYNTVKNKFVVNMPPQKFFNTLQKELLQQAKKNKRRTPEEIQRLKKETPEEFRETIGGLYESRVQEYMKDLQEGKDVPTGYILKSETISEKGKPSTHVEFDTLSGVEAARRLGIPKVPVVLAEGRTSKYTKGKFWPQWEYTDTELENQADEARRYSISMDDTRSTNTGDAQIIRLGEKMLKKGAPIGSKYESDYEDDVSDKWREVTTIDMSKVKEIERDDTGEDMAIRFGRRPKGFNQDEWTKYQATMNKITHKETQVPFDQSIKMNTVLEQDREIKRLEKVNPFWRREDMTPTGRPTWNQKYNAEAYNALKGQGYDEDEVTTYLAHKNLVAQDFADILSKQPGMRSITTGEKVTEDVNPADQERLREAFQEHKKSTQTIRLNKIKSINQEPGDEE